MIMKKFLFSLWFCFLSIFLTVSTVSAEEFTIMVDPGHGKNDPGAVSTFNGKTYIERDLNFRIAGFLKAKLETYTTRNGDPIRVKFTRTSDNDLTLEQRVARGVSKNSNLLISIHNNAAADKNPNRRGSMVLVTNAHYQAPEAKHVNLYLLENALAESILIELQKVGLSLSDDVSKPDGSFICKNGILRRIILPPEEAEDSSAWKYQTGEPLDYYGIVREGVLAGLPSIIIEYAYISNQQDAEQFLSSDAQLKRIAEASAQGIASVYSFLPRQTEAKSLEAPVTRSAEPRQNGLTLFPVW